jgi:VCBS repeat-containing protein
VNDAETPAGSLVVNATSSNTTLVPNGNIVLGGSGSNRTLTITPTANLSGTSTITVTATDANNLTTTSTFVLTVNPQNDVPTIGAIANQSTNEDTATSAISVNVNDVETAAGSLTVTATSDNPTLVPNANIVVGGTGANRTLTITPAANQSGTANITVTTSDPNGGTTSSTFVLTVNAQNDLPTVSAVANQTINEDAATGALAFTVNDAETAAGSLTVTASSSDTTLVPNANIVLGGSGSNRTLTVTPAANQSGTATITVTATDANGGTTNSTFVVSVTGQNDVPTLANISDVSTAEDTAAAPFTITLGDVETPNGLTVTATSSNPSIVANSGVAITGTGTTRTVTVTPVANATGTANITVTVTDPNGGTVSDTFAVNISAVNDAPLAVDDTANVNFPDNSTIALMLAGNVLSNDTDADTGTTLNVTGLGTGTVGQSIQMTYGDLVVNANGSYTYTIDPDLVDQFMAGDDLQEVLNYTVSDGTLSDTGTLTINLHIT